MFFVNYALVSKPKLNSGIVCVLYLLFSFFLLWTPYSVKWPLSITYSFADFQNENCCNIAVNNFKSAVERIEWYCQRWAIELYHKVLKSGCRVEDCLLETATRLKRYLALMCVVAWRLFWLTHINRQNPDASCRTILAEHEWQALYCRINKTTELPKKPPTVGQAVRWIAQLGGFLGRKSDGEPGITVIWRGWQRLNDI